MFKQYFEQIKDIDIFPIISMIIFIIFFSIIIIWISGKNKKYFTEMEDIPFENKDKKIQN